jgi:hypothetical protein
MRCVAATLICAGAGFFWQPAARAQKITPLDQLPAAASALEDGQNHESLPCKVHPVKPALNFDFRFQAGYTFETSLDPYLEGQHHWDIVFRVTPENGAGQPVYFLDSIDIAAPRMIGLIGEYSGAFETGEGRYRVKWSLVDDLGRVCREEWAVDAHRTVGERSEKIAMPPDTVSDFSWRPGESTGAVTPGTVTKSRHATILLNTAIPAPRLEFASLAQIASLEPRPEPWGMLLSMLASIVKQMPEVAVRVIAFDTGQRQELLRKDNFTPADMNDVARLADAQQRWAVDYHAVQDVGGGWNLLRDMENKEINAPSPPDTVIFLGVPDGRFDKMPPGMPGPKAAVRFFYLKYGPALKLHFPVAPDNPHRPESHPSTVRPLPPDSFGDKPDLIEQSVQHLKGKSFLILSPVDFSKAVAAIRR